MAPLSQHFAPLQPPQEASREHSSGRLKTTRSYGGWRSSQGVGWAGSDGGLGAAVLLSFPASKATTPWLMADTPAPTQAAQIPILSQGSSYSASLGVRPGASPGMLFAGISVRDSVAEDGGL